MPDGTLKYVYNNTKLDGETMSQWKKEYDRLGEEGKEELRVQAQKEMDAKGL